MNDNSSANTTILSFALGAAVGAGLALLLAPDTGEATRNRLADAARRMGTKVKDTAGHLASDAREAIESGQSAFQQERQKREAARV